MRKIIKAFVGLEGMPPTPVFTFTLDDNTELRFGADIDAFIEIIIAINKHIEKLEEVARRFYPEVFKHHD